MGSGIGLKRVARLEVVLVVIVRAELKLRLRISLPRWTLLMHEEK